MVNKLAGSNKQFKIFLQSVTEDIGLQRVKNANEYDAFLSEEALRKHVEKLGIAQKKDTNAPRRARRLNG